MRLFIRWHEFLEALKKQNPSTLEIWLRRWHFTNEGVILAEANRNAPPFDFFFPCRSLFDICIEA